MKYDTQLGEVTGLLPSTQNVLVTLPSQPSIDELAGGLALFLSLQQAGKEVAIVTEGIIRVGHTNLFGVGEIQSKIPEGKGGDFVITIGGVASVGPDGKGTVPSLEKLDYYTSGSDLNLVFKVLPGQNFEPQSVTPRHMGGDFGLVFIIGASNLMELGGIYSAGQQIFSNSYLVNIDNGQGNGQFGKVNVVDSEASSLSEMVSQVLSALNLPVNGDIASNILSGIFAATSDLQERNAGADTFEVVAAALRAGGQKPLRSTPSAAEMGNTASGGNLPFGDQGTTSPQSSTPSGSEQGFDLSKVFNISPLSNNSSSGTEVEPQPSPEETPAGEGVEVITPEADWLTPKIFTGKKSVG